MGYNSLKVDDDKMAHIAKKIGDRLVEGDYWELIKLFGDEYMKD